MTPDAARLPTHSVTVPMTASLERLLVGAANARGQTPEALVKQVLCDWLLADRGLTGKRGGSKIAASANSARAG